MCVCVCVYYVYMWHIYKNAVHPPVSGLCFPCMVWWVMKIGSENQRQREGGWRDVVRCVSASCECRSDRSGLDCYSMWASAGGRVARLCWLARLAHCCSDRLGVAQCLQMFDITHINRVRLQVRTQDALGSSCVSSIKYINTTKLATSSRDRGKAATHHLKM